MDVLLLSGRSRGAAPHPSREEAAALARALALAGHRVRWLCPVRRGGGPAVHLPEAASFVPIVSHAPSFRCVERGLDDTPVERALTAEIRRRLPDVVHVLAFGGAQSAASVWIADRLGATAVASVDARELLCHRGTLVNEHGRPCDDWERAARCHACCMSPFEHGLGVDEARWSRRLRALGAWSPFPTAAAFENRLDVVIAGLLPASLVLACSPEDRALLVRAGVPAHKVQLRAATAPNGSSLERLYEKAVLGLPGS